MVTYSIHLYSRSSHHFILWFLAMLSADFLPVKVVYRIHLSRFHKSYYLPRHAFSCTSCLHGAASSWSNESVLQLSLTVMRRLIRRGLILVQWHIFARRLQTWWNVHTADLLLVSCQSFERSPSWVRPHLIRNKSHWWMFVSANGHAIWEENDNGGAVETRAFGK